MNKVETFITLEILNEFDKNIFEIHPQLSYGAFYSNLHYTDRRNNEILRSENKFFFCNSLLFSC